MQNLSKQTPSIKFIMASPILKAYSYPLPYSIPGYSRCITLYLFQTHSASPRDLQTFGSFVVGQACVECNMEKLKSALEDGTLPLNSMWFGSFKIETCRDDSEFPVTGTNVNFKCSWFADKGVVDCQ